MTERKTQSWRPGKRDFVFLALVAAVILLLVLGTGDRTTKAVPADETHSTALTREVCLSCHGVNGVRPQTAGHTKADQCFQCHSQPEGWQGAGK